MNTSKDQIQIHLHEILESKTFSRSNVNVTLLKYLVNATLEKKNLKESSIGQELFGKDYDPIKNDNKVRVYVHNLRKKLDDYYTQENSKSTYRFVIEKGQYEVSFLLNTNKKRNRLTYLGLAFTAVIVMLLQFILSKDKNEATFWKNFSSNQNDNTVLVGDHFTIAGSLQTGGRGIIRDYAINSENELSELLSARPDLGKNLKANRFTYITKMGTYSINRLSQFFTQQKIDYNLMLNSEWDKSRFGNENILFVGQYKTMGFLQNIFNEKHPNFRYQNMNITYINPIDNSTETYVPKADSVVVDYTFVSKTKVRKDTELLMFLSDHDIGAIQAIEYFTNSDSLDSFYSRHNIDDEFTALFKVSGWDRVGFKMELVRLEK